MTRDARERLLDIRDAIDATQAHVGGSLSAPSVDEDIVMHAVLFNLMVIGEATKNVAMELQGQEPNIPWEDIAGLRDFIAHRYFRIEKTIIEDTVRKDLPDLQAAVARLLA